MRISPLGRPGAVLRGATPVPDREGPPGGGRGGAAGPGDLRIQLALANNPADGCVAGDPAHGLGGDDGTTVEFAAGRTRRTNQRVRFASARAAWASIRCSKVLATPVNWPGSIVSARANRLPSALCTAAAPTCSADRAMTATC